MSDRKPRVSPRDPRDKTRVKIMEETQALIHEVGTDGLKATTIIENAGLSSPSAFYRRFDDVDQVVSAILYDVVVGFETTVTKVLSPQNKYGTIEEVTDALVDEFVIFFRRNKTIYFELWFEHMTKLGHRQEDRDRDRAFAKVLAEYLLDNDYIANVSIELRAHLYYSWKIAEALLHEAFDSPTFTDEEDIIAAAKRTITLRITDRSHDLYAPPKPCPGFT